MISIERTDRSSPGDRAYYQERLVSRRDRIRQRGIRRFVRQILLTGEEPHERPAPLSPMVADGALQHRIASLESVQDRPLRNLARNLKVYFAADLRQRSQMRREHHSDHLFIAPNAEL
jgi:hypothetical protein